MATGRVVYRINGKSVGNDKFEALLKSLKEIHNTWFCHDMSFIDADGREVGGGKTGYDAKDKDGNVYEYRCIDSPDDNSCSITIKAMAAHFRRDPVV